MALRARLTPYDDSSFALQSTYDPDFIAALKSEIAYADRNWEKTSKLWLIHNYCKHDILQLLQRHNYIVEDCTQEDPQIQHTAPIVAVPNMPEDLLQAFRCLYLDATCPLKAAEIMYKGLAQLLHPDKGGNADGFRQISDAIATIRQYLK